MCSENSLNWSWVFSGWGGLLGLVLSVVSSNWLSTPSIIHKRRLITTLQWARGLRNSPQDQQMTTTDWTRGWREMKVFLVQCSKLLEVGGEWWYWISIPADTTEMEKFSLHNWENCPICITNWAWNLFIGESHQSTVISKLLNIGPGSRMIMKAWPDHPGSCLISDVRLNKRNTNIHKASDSYLRYRVEYDSMYRVWNWTKSSGSLFC